METRVASPRIGVHAQITKPQRMNALSVFLPLAMLVAVALPCAATGADRVCPELKQTTGAVSQLLAEGNAAFEIGDSGKAEVSWMKIRECAPATPDWPKAVFNLGLPVAGSQNARPSARRTIVGFAGLARCCAADGE